MVLEMRTRKHIELEICECEEQFLYFEKFNRLADARSEQLRKIDLELELAEMGAHEDAERMGFCYE